MTREEAIEILKTDGCFGCYVEKDNPYNCNDGGCEIREAYYMAIEALEQTRWIPCSERLPEVGKMVLTINDHSQCNVLSITVYDTWHDWDDCFVNDYIIAWMPLPEAWKGEKG